VSIPPPEPPPALPSAIPPAAQQPAWQVPPQQPAWQPPPQQQQSYPGAYPPAQYYGTAPQKPKTLGVVAFIPGLVVLLVSPIVSAVAGATVGHVVQPGSGFAEGFAAGANSRDPQNLIAGLLIVVQILLGTGLGAWAIVQGILAVRARRGRSWGIAAIVLAGVAPILSFIVYLVAATIAQTAG
jgi:hypothetical protein